MASSKQISQETVNSSITLTTDGVATGILAQKFTTTDAITVDKLYFNKVSGSPLVVSISVYTDSGGSPGTSVGGDSAILASNGWVEVSIGTPFDLDAATDYWIYILPGAGETVEIGTDSGNSYGDTETSVASVPWDGTTFNEDMSFQTWGELTLPSKATSPTPSDTATGVKKSLAQVSWSDGGGADTFNVYFGPTGNVTLRSSAQAGTSWTVTDTLSYNTEYTWRIDSTNANGTTTGDTWTFTTEVFDPPVASAQNTMKVNKILVAAANDKVYYET